ncbi:MAG: class I SAM-dependent methyltransferase [Solirubrobacteraceae bacterium]
MTIRCPLCGASVVEEFVATDRNRRLSTERFVYHRCTRCATLVLAPIPSDLARYYTAEYYAVPADRAQILAASGSEYYKLEIVRSFVPQGRVVEVGPAVGGFVAVMQEAGYEVAAIEMDPDCCRFLRDQLGIRVWETDEPASALADGEPFDVVAMWHVIEHLPNPREVIEAAARALAPGGVLALAAPNPESFQFRLFRKRWTHLDAPRHLVLAPMSEFARVGAEAGLEPVLMTTRDEGTLGWNTFGWRESFAGFSRGRYMRHALRLTGGVVGRVMAFADRRGRNGSTFTLVMRKPA